MTTQELFFLQVSMKIVIAVGGIYIVRFLVPLRVSWLQIIPGLILYGLLEGGMETIYRLLDGFDWQGINVKFFIYHLIELIIDFIFVRCLIMKVKTNQTLFVLFFTSISSLVLFLLPVYGVQLFAPDSWNRYVLILIQLLGYLVLVYLAFWLLSKTKAAYYLHKLARYPKIYLFMGIAYSGLTILFQSSDSNWLLWVLAFIGVIILCIALVREFENRITMKQNQQLILQQQNYVTKLEGIQKDLGMILHDYKNMVTGLYAYADEGDTNSIKNYISTKLLQVDIAVQQNIRQMKQVSRISLPELKGLVLGKLIVAEQKEISVNLEVQHSIDEISMETGNFVRCVGILLDNALEEAEKFSKPEIAVIFLQEGNMLTVVVRNPILQKPDLSRIYQAGYSTKGEKRGLGLVSYQEILRQYSNVITETRIEKQCFVQSLILQNPVKKDRKATI